MRFIWQRKAGPPHSLPDLSLAPANGGSLKEEEVVILLLLQKKPAEY